MNNETRQFIEEELVKLEKKMYMKIQEEVNKALDEILGDRVAVREYLEDNIFNI